MRAAVLLFPLLAGCSPTPADNPPPTWTAETQTVADGSNRFAFDLYTKLGERPGNLFFSPYSVHAALAMTAHGANGATRDEMVKVLHLPADRTAGLAAGDLGRWYAAGGKPYQLDVANALWGQAGHQFRKPFLADLDGRFGAGLRTVDFKGDREAARRTINGWVEQKTRDRIKELLQSTDLDDRTRLVLTNAVYFKGQWPTPFPKVLTKEAPFHLADGAKASAPLMHRRDTFRYAETDGLQVLELPYKGDELALVVILPRTPDGLPAVEKSLSAEQLTKWMAAATSEDVDVYLPKFRTEQRVKLGETLAGMGMPLAFDEFKADFTDMVDGGPANMLFIQKVIHQAFCEVNEEGTEAAAATAVVMAPPRSAAGPPPKQPKLFRADRPFTYLIRDTKHGTVLFAGRLAKP